MFVKSTSSPAELREIATGLGIVWVGKSNEDLANEINAKMEVTMNKATVTNHTNEEFAGVQPGETKAAFPTAEETTEEVVEEEIIEDQEVTEETPAEENKEEEPQLKVVPKEDKPAATKTSGKWYEQEGAFPYEAGQKIEITEMENRKHSFLDGRTAIINGPSTKKNAVKAQLINKDGKLQKTQVTFNFTEFKTVTEENTQGAV